MTQQSRGETSHSGKTLSRLRSVAVRRCGKAQQATSHLIKCQLRENQVVAARCVVGELRHPRTTTPRRGYTVTAFMRWVPNETADSLKEWRKEKEMAKTMCLRQSPPISWLSSSFCSWRRTSWSCHSRTDLRHLFWCSFRASCLSWLTRFPSCLRKN